MALSRRFVAFDTETSGLDPARDRILQLGAVRWEAGGVRQRFRRLIRFDGDLPLAVLRLTGLRPEELRAASPAAEVLRDFVAFAGEDPLVAHNASFDLAFLDRALDREGFSPLPNRCYDTLELARLVDPLRASHQLGQLARAYGLELERAHDAEADAEATAHLFARLQERLGQLPAELRQTLLAWLLPTDSPVVDLLLEVVAPAAEGGAPAAARAGSSRPRVILAPEPAEGGVEELAGTAVDPGRDLVLAGGGEGSLAGRPPRPPAAEELFSAGGLLGRLEGFETRPGQAAMATAVARALDRRLHLVVEAGTGTGKSLAYLVPALLFARRQRQRVAVATHTVNLQEQLWERELPWLARHLPVPFRAALVKGRSQYVCLLRWERLTSDPSAVEERERPALARLSSWLAQTRRGDRSEAPLYGEEEQRLWSRLEVDAQACLGPECRWADRCFWFRARREAERADLLVVNHSLLLSHYAAGEQVLPPFAHAVIDEAHHLAEEAARHFGVRLSADEAEENLDRLLARRRGLLAALAALASAPAAGAGPGEAVERVRQAAEEARQAGRLVWQALAARLTGGSEGGQGGAERLPSRFWQEGAVADLAGTWRDRLRRLASELDRLAQQLAQRSLSSRQLRPETRLELEAARSETARELAALETILNADPEATVVWLEGATRRRGGRQTVTPVLAAAPFEAGPLLRRHVWENLEGAVLTSATLTVAGQFAPLLDALGLEEDDRLETLQVESPFHYREQALLAVPNDMPDLGREPEASRAVARFLEALLRRTGGRTLVLFTSHRMLRTVYFQLKPRLEAEGIELLAQGLDGSRSRLAEALRADQGSVVFGSSSFWEGVDIPGEALSCVVMVKLPFAPPTSPILAARSEACSRAGGNGFLSVAVPDAVIRFKQGFGRLIRRASDRGAVVVLDARLVDARKSYGQIFLESLPGPEVLVAPSAAVIEKVAAWLGEAAAPPAGSAAGI
ncbi:MAG: helicase C-terminal domain-containing protein [Bacillota bacterium]|nr:helicase C-terminal domain-containing protein [Bacillota bacterium]